MSYSQIDFWQLLSVKTETDGDNIKKEKETEEETKEDPGIEADFLDEELDLLTNMIHAPAPQYHHSRPFQVSRKLSNHFLQYNGIWLGWSIRSPGSFPEPM